MNVYAIVQYDWESQETHGVFERREDADQVIARIAAGAVKHRHDPNTAHELERLSIEGYDFYPAGDQQLQLREQWDSTLLVDHQNHISIARATTCCPHVSNLPPPAARATNEWRTNGIRVVGLGPTKEQAEVAARAEAARIVAERKDSP